MINGTLQIRKLTEADKDSFLKMETGIEDDYVARIFPRLVTSKDHVMYGLFDSENMLSIGGFSIFANHYAMLGRLRSDTRYLGKGNATELMKKIIKDATNREDIFWIGANTNVDNNPARKVLDKLSLSSYYALYPHLLETGCTVSGTTGPLWDEVTSKEEKKQLLVSLKDTELFTYECYYPFPLENELFHDEYLDTIHVYMNPDKTRFFTMKEDQKGELYALVNYFWDDPFDVPGFWDTVSHLLTTHYSNHILWLDFTEQMMKANKANLKDFTVKKPWILYGKSVK